MRQEGGGHPWQHIQASLVSGSGRHSQRKDTGTQRAGLNVARLAGRVARTGTGPLQCGRSQSLHGAGNSTCPEGSSVLHSQRFPPPPPFFRNPKAHHHVHKSPPPVPTPHQLNPAHASTFCPHSVFMCFVWVSEQTAIISLYSIN
jgi:hypothetical protein